MASGFQQIISGGNNFIPKHEPCFLVILSLVIKLSIRRNLYISPSFTSIFKNQEEIAPPDFIVGMYSERDVWVIVSVSHLEFSKFQTICANTSLRSTGVCNFL